MTEWIYESPDGGKTIYRRVLGKHEATPGRQCQVAPGVWFSIDQLTEFGKQAYRQQCLRLEYPALNQLWEEYQAMLRLVSNNREG
jgi:hypothetical protein